jgi:microsomal dipeptidase-like Zn-dependent dipeptidase
LHAHPASHLSFGADAGGNNGIFWGKPGLNLEASRATLNSDLPACAPDKHGSFDGDPVRHRTHITVIGTLDSLTGFTHQASGAPSFSNWPNARSVTHQQMHITSIRRAYDGGQRLMIASVTNNELLAALWTKIGYNIAGNQVPLHDVNFDYESAKRQLAFIKQLAAANPAWMEIAYSAADARSIIAKNKMALILSIEMDALSPAQVMRLVKEEGVRHVIPIHLINNQMGGCAVYSDAFNTANAFVNSTRQSGNWNNLGNDGFFRVNLDARLTNRLGRPQTVVSGGADAFSGGAIKPTPVDDATFKSLRNYDAPGTAGHKNAQGITAAGSALIRDLAREGVLIDVVHMGELSTSGALTFGVFNKYPMMNSHTGLREPDETAANERALMREHARLISNLGGVIGLGTEGTSGQVPIVNQPAMPGNSATPLVYFNPLKDWVAPLQRPAGNPLVSHLTVTIKTFGESDTPGQVLTFGGGDPDLRGGNNGAWAWVTIKGVKKEYDLSQRARWVGGSVHSRTFALPPGTRMRDIGSFTLHATPEGKNGPFDAWDGWGVASVRVEATLAGIDTVGTWLKEYKDALSLMKGRGMAIGTDINGFAPQLAFSAEPVRYPFRAYGKTDAPELSRSQMGPRPLDFQRDGIAHYGMLADFMQAVSQKPDSGDAMKALFRSANDVVEMWEKCEARKSSIR